MLFFEDFGDLRRAFSFVALLVITVVKQVRYYITCNIGLTTDFFI